MKILLTGGTGFFGGELLRSFLTEGYSVILSCRQPKLIVDTPLGESLCDVCGIAPNELAGIFKKHPDIAAVVHGATDYGRSASLPTLVFSGNLKFPIRLLEEAMVAKIPIFINIDTFFSANKDNYQHLAEYALSKRHFKEWGELCAMHRKIRFINFRLFHLYGPGDNPKKFVSEIIRDCLRNSEINLTHGLQRRDFIFCKDASIALNCILKAESMNSAGYVNYDVGSGKSCTIREFVETIKRLTGSRSNLNFGELPSRSGEFVDACADLRALRTIGWSPTTVLEDGLILTINEQRSFNNKGFYNDEP